MLAEMFMQQSRTVVRGPRLTGVCMCVCACGVSVGFRVRTSLG